MPAANTADDEKTRLIVSSRRRFNQGFIEPKPLRFDKINAVFGLVGRALPRIELKLHAQTLV